MTLKQHSWEYCENFLVAIWSQIVLCNNLFATYSQLVLIFVCNQSQFIALSHSQKQIWECFGRVWGTCDDSVPILRKNMSHEYCVHIQNSHDPDTMPCDSGDKIKNIPECFKTFWKLFRKCTFKLPVIQIQCPATHVTKLRTFPNILTHFGSSSTNAVRNLPLESQPSEIWALDYTGLAHCTFIWVVQCVIYCKNAQCE